MSNGITKSVVEQCSLDWLAGQAEELRLALADYPNSKGKGEIKLDQEEAVAVMLEKYENVWAILHGFHYASAAEAAPAQRMPFIARVAEHVLLKPDGNPRHCPPPPAQIRQIRLSARQAGKGHANGVGAGQVAIPSDRVAF